ncbi:Hypothetical protein SRAE_1000188700 [Strongyloides ratti]|uniref:Uncharacterized protein n=1 Tax=Strongyloides ratti TaxID=34506 RepID=A0A090L1Q0_STRRB|nr:Hypothetical protein SRAE_1000188700 [Strongyloides ratti]CEF63627.1 Hypothetical protein SRAE_1000188700 [Strongyloides ratti]
MIIKIFQFIILLSFILLYVNGNEYCSTLISCKYEVQKQFRLCIQNVLKLFLETNNFPENYLDAIKCKKNAQTFEKLQNNSIITKHNETLTCANNTMFSDSFSNSTKLKCSILTSEIKNKYIFKNIGKSTFEECLDQKVIADERCEVIEECCPTIGKCNPIYNKPNQERFKRIFKTKSQILTNCFFNHKIALVNPEQILSSNVNKTVDIKNITETKNNTQSNVNINQIVSNNDNKVRKITKEEKVVKKQSSNKKKKNNKLKKKGHGNLSLDETKNKINQNKKQKESYKLNTNIARKVFATWGCNSVEVLNSLVNVFTKKCSKIQDKSLKEDTVKMPTIETIENVLRKDQKVLTAHCVREHKEFGGKCSDETNLAPYKEIGDNIQFCRNYDILDSYKEILDSNNDADNCHIKYSKFKLHLYKLKNCCLWNFKQN